VILNITEYWQAYKKCNNYLPSRGSGQSSISALNLIVGSITLEMSFSWLQVLQLEAFLRSALSFLPTETAALITASVNLDWVGLLS